MRESPPEGGAIPASFMHSVCLGNEGKSAAVARRSGQLPFIGALPAAAVGCSRVRTEAQESGLASLVAARE